MGELPTPPPDFTPVPVRARRDGWSPERQFAYVVALALLGHGGRAAQAVGMTGQSACRLRRRPGADAFNRLCEAAWGLARRRQARERLARLRARRVGRFSASREAET
ncbi:MAG: LysR family transcriptional regulator [Allosphingosinicella sp.]